MKSATIEKATTQPQLQMQYHFIDFMNMRQLQRHTDILVSLIDCYRTIFAEPDVWNESYSDADVLKKLHLELAGSACLRVCISDVNQQVIGFCWAQLLTGEQVATAVNAIHFVDQSHCQNLNEQIMKTVGHKPVIYIQDLGIKKEYRSKVSLELLISPVLETVAQQAKTRQLFFWSVTDTCIWWMAKKIGIKPAFNIESMQFFSGDLPLVYR